jgi:hypothetical protein
MDAPESFGDEVEPGIGEAERAALWRIADALIAARPYPRAAYRSTVNQWLALKSTHERPRALWARVGALAGTGVVLLALVAIGLAGSGPFAA